MSDIHSRVEDACTTLAGNHQQVTFSAVAVAADVSRATLYRNPTLRALVEHHRQATAPATTFDRIADDIATLRITVEALADQVRRQGEQIRRLNRLTTKPTAD
jgi:hypothetical protein